MYLGIGLYSILLLLSACSGILAKEDSEMHLRFKRSTVVDSHVYYQSFIYRNGSTEAAQYLRLFDDEFANNHIRSSLSEMHLKFQKLIFSKPVLFYGHLVHNISLTTGGFLFMDNYTHNKMLYTQQVAPLLQNFNPSLSSLSHVLFRYASDVFYAFWKDVYINDHMEYGTFSFQLALCSNGTIIFAYRQIPINVSHISTSSHPLTVGLSDAYYYDTQITSGTQRSIITYHRLNLPLNEVKTGAVIRLVPYPTCVEQTTCEMCLSKSTSFNCSWCPAVDRCSSGIDRMLQEWQSKSCHVNAYWSSCGVTATTKPPTTTEATTKPPTTTEVTTKPPTTTEATTKPPTTTEATTKPPTTTEVTTKPPPKTTKSTKAPVYTPSPYVDCSSVNGRGLCSSTARIGSKQEAKAPDILPVIVGAIVAGLLLIIGIAIAVVFYVKRRRGSLSRQSENPMELAINKVYDEEESIYDEINNRMSEVDPSEYATIDPYDN